jgi:hypothetical protein
VPLGDDPAVVMTALRHGGYTAVVDTAHGVERVLIECERWDRNVVRSIIEQARRSAAAESGATVGHAVFEDEG